MRTKKKRKRKKKQTALHLKEEMMEGEELLGRRGRIELVVLVDGDQHIPSAT